MKAVRGVAWGFSLVPRVVTVVPPIAANEVGQVSLANQTQVDPTRDIGVDALTLAAQTASPFAAVSIERNVGSETVDAGSNSKVVEPYAVSIERIGGE